MDGRSRTMQEQLPGGEGIVNSPRLGPPLQGEGIHF